ncbi:MAG: hypothetical protein FJ087_09510 [Deltaproteobacteria bacterium]|nr:hypothetical protein [Deltaproteobacteria bacterium]
MRRRPDRRAFVAPALVLALAGYGAGPIVEAAHIAASEHRVCPEHGDLTHGAHHGHDGHGHAHGHAHAHGVPGEGVCRDVPAAQAAHTHCSFAEHQSRPVAAVVPPPHAGREVPAVAATATGSPLGARLPALRAAPKQSPPSA